MSFIFMILLTLLLLIKVIIPGDDHMDSTDLNFFSAVALAGGIGRAAHDLHTVQSNVTQRIRALENQLGVQLFHRSKKGVTLTSMGSRLLPYAKRISDLLAEAHCAVKDEAWPGGELRIGSMETTAALRLPPVFLASVHKSRRLNESMAANWESRCLV